MPALSMKEFLPASAIARITDTRVNDPEFSFRAAAARKRRTVLAPDGKLNILAADHPARRVTKGAGDPLAMADRHDLLARIVRVLMSGMVDGVMATMDVLEELLTLDGFLREAGASPILDEKLLIASLNRGGLAQTCWELDDPTTGPGPAACTAWHLDGAKFLLRIADDDAGSLATLEAAARAITEANALALPSFLEPLPMVKTENGWGVVKTAEALARIVGVASALGDSSRYLWLKLPYCESYEIVARATTLPVLLLGGETKGDPVPFLGQVKSALAAAPNVRGALVGRNVLYPGEGDPLAVAEAAGGIIHQGWSLEQATEHLRSESGRGWNVLSVLERMPRRGV
jgi:DhnA family fructose-bisphosphate aldolase class Ia